MRDDIEKKFPLIRDIAVRSGLDIINALIGLITITLVANHLDAQSYGIYTQAITTTALLTPLLILRLNTASVRFFPEFKDNKNKLKDQIMTIFMLVVILCTTIVSMMLFSLPYSTILIFGDNIGDQLTIYLAIFIIIRCLSTLLIDYFRALGNVVRASTYNTIRIMLTFIAIVTVLINNGGAITVLKAHCIAEMLIILAVCLKLIHSQLFGLPFTISASQLKPYLKYSLPLVPYTFLLSVNHLSDRYFITHMIGLDEAGTYTFAYSMITATFLLSTALSYAIYPHLSRLWQERNFKDIEIFIKIGQKIFLYFSIPVIFGVLVIYQPLVAVIVGERFSIDSATIIYIAIGNFSLGLSTFYGYLIDLTKKTFLYVKILLLTSSINLVLNWTLIPVIGIEGAALSTALTFTVQLAVLILTSRKLTTINIHIEWVFAFYCLLSSLLMYSILSFVGSGPTTEEILFTISLGILVYFVTSAPLIWKDANSMFYILRPKFIVNKDD